MENVTVIADNTTINDLDDFCSDFEYYTISIINDSSFSCIHRCDANSPKPYCANGGECNATVLTPECVCLPTSIFWHRDSQCNLFANAAAIAGITVPLVLLLIIIVIVVVLMLMRRAHTKTFSVESSCSSFSRHSTLSFGSFKALPEWQDNPNYDVHVEDVREEGTSHMASCNCLWTLSE
uniref:Mucin-12-like n=1 Tax=Petromyzon marinus TaxID=7757 RepID=A0AAJ7THV3_PETMA|nr:mucin-12-like [Petromyzon marinus]